MNKTGAWVIIFLNCSHLFAGAGGSMEKMIGQMLVIGFRGLDIADDSPIARNLRERYLGGVIFFDRDLTTQSDIRNIQSPSQVARLSERVTSLASVPPFISVDQEGGFVTRLKPKHGFPRTLSALKLAQLPVRELEAECASLAAMVKGVGINLNFTPAVDLNLNPQNPIIGAYERSFSADPDVVVEKATAVIEAHHREGVLASLKHFPGHGSSKADTHLGMADVSDTWREIELEPYRRLIDAGKVDLVMTAHVFNRHLDERYPATLSPSIIPQLLRGRLRFDGVVATDDMQMGAIAKHYGLEEAVRLALAADMDILTFGNNVSYDENIMERVVAIILKLVETGEVTESRIRRSYDRITRLKGRLTPPR